MIDTTKKTRLEFLANQFNIDYNKGVKRGRISVQIDPETNSRFTYDKYFLNYQELVFGITDVKGVDYEKEIFDFFVNLDPTTNKEYVSWFMFLYRNILKMPNDEPEEIELYQEAHKLFFEDLATKVYDGINVFNLLKKTKAFTTVQRDINSFRTISEFILFIKPYLQSGDSDEDDSTHTLTAKELASINNFVSIANGGPDNGYGLAELVFENKDWVVVSTHDKKSNDIFGLNTTWCTAGTRYRDMFSGYYSRGNLFVLIKKGYGSKKCISQNPLVRLQFHFEDDQFMNALDQRIKINDFLFNNPEVKDFFRTYIIKNVLPKRALKYKQSDNIKYLLNLGFGDEIIKIFKQTKPTVVDFSGYKIDAKYLKNIGEITSIVKLDLSDCSLDHLPESIQNLVNLEHLKIRNNKKLTTIPNWINKLTKLKYLDCSGCDITNELNLYGLNNILELVLDFNENLTKLPCNLGTLTELQRLTAAGCNISQIPDDIINCINLFLVDVHSNENLDRIPLGLSKLPEIVAICIDDTKISPQTKKLMEENSNGSVCIIKYD